MKPAAICAVAPAAGRGSRLGFGAPKLLAPLGAGRTVWSVLSAKLFRVAEHINLIVSPDGYDAIAAAAAAEIAHGRVTLTIQPEPKGMGDAIFRGSEVWSRAQAILVVWGDQVFVSQETLTRACRLHHGEERTIVLPVTRLEKPYVEYVFDDHERLSTVRQSREGDCCAPNGFGDIGTFVLSVRELETRWREYLRSAVAGSSTGEVNFLPFLPYLGRAGWTIKRLEIADAREARGINTPEDLAFFQALFANQTEPTGAMND